MSQELVSFDTSVYRLAAIKKAAYKFGDRCFVQISSATPSTVEVFLKPKSDKVSLEQVAGELRNEVLDQELREQIAEETAGIRTLLLAQAFSATSLVDPVGEEADYRSDPLGICVSDSAAATSRHNGSSQP